MAGDHHNSGMNRKGGMPVEDDGTENERLWIDFESCAQTVTRLYRDPTWKSLQTAAASTTQLYKSSMDSYRKGYDKGFVTGRSTLAKEVLAAISSGSKMDLNTLLELLYRNMGRSCEESHKTSAPLALSGETVNAVHLFQQALTPSLAASPQRAVDLNNFLTTQVQRHRKRQRSPSSPSSLIKKLRKS